MRRVFDYINSYWTDPDDQAEQRKDYAQENLIGLDNDRRLVRVAKAYMIMENDGRGGIHFVDSLDYTVWPVEVKRAIVGRPNAGQSQFSDLASLVRERKTTDGVDIILTNPPFAGAIKAPKTLQQYDLAHNAKGRQKGKVVRAELFLERCLDLLVPGGRMAIVLPQGLLNNINDQDVRDFVDRRARILAVVGLHPDTFKPFTLAKTSVLFLQKWRDGDQSQDDYRIFTAVSMRPGKTRLGRPQYLSDGVTLDCDMDQIADAFSEFAEQEGLKFAGA